MKQLIQKALQYAPSPRAAIALSMTALLASSCGAPGAGPAADSGLKLGSLLPSTGDLGPVGQPMVSVVPLLVETVNQCGGVNGKPVELIAADDETDATKGNAAMTKLAEVDKVAGVVGSFASSVSQSAVDVAVRNKVMLVSPGSTSPAFTERAKKGDFKVKKDDADFNRCDQQ
jgi:neutral amino acid transport system substrate-binding protein